MKDKINCFADKCLACVKKSTPIRVPIIVPWKWISQKEMEST
jgi:hypothetical protein